MGTPEPFVSVEVAAEFVGVTPRALLDLVRDGDLPAYPLAVGRKRNMWRFRLSELERALCHNGDSFTAPLSRRTYRSRQS
jgi:hypothetical protein